MNSFVVPQFIDVEAKILGPITMRQFIISLIGGFGVVIAYKTLGTGSFVLALLAIGGIVFLFGFFKVNGRSFHQFLLSVLETMKRPGIRVWRSNPVLAKEPATKGEIGDMVELQKKSGQPLNRSRLQELSLVVDTGGVYKSDQ